MRYKCAETIRSDHKTLAIKSRGESRQIAANHGKFHSKNMFLKNREGSHTETRPKNNGDHFGGEIVAVFGILHFCGRMIFFSIQSVVFFWVMVCIPSSLYQIFYQIF